MEKKEMLFIVTFTLSLALLVFFLGTSITGLVIQTMHCDAEGCNKICWFSTDCSPGEICCQSPANTGICISQCQTPYQYNPAAELSNPIPVNIDYTPTPQLQQPLQLRTNIQLYTSLLALIIFIGILFFLGKKPQVKTKSKRKAKKK